MRFSRFFLSLHSHDVKYGSGSGQQSVTGEHFYRFSLFFRDFLCVSFKFFGFSLIFLYISLGFFDFPLYFLDLPLFFFVFPIYFLDLPLFFLFFLYISLIFLNISLIFHYFPLKTGMQANNDYNSLWTIKEGHNLAMKHHSSSKP